MLQKGTLFLLIDPVVNRTKKNPTAKDINNRILSRWLELTLARLGEKNLYYSWLILLVLSLIFAALLLNWAAAIKPPPVKPDIAISVAGTGGDNLEVMIIYTGGGISIKYLTYNSSHGGGFINRSANPFEHIRDAGEEGTIPVSAYDGELEIFATLNDGRTIIIYSKKAKVYTEPT